MEYRSPTPGHQRQSEVRFAVRLTPRGGDDRVDGVSPDGVLQARVAAPAVGGAANSALVKLIADELDLPRTSVRLVAGASGRHKLIVVEGFRAEGLVERWPGLKV
jgi:uncharacterized protein YggU (UPF0235/DUF167 family)